MRYGCNRGAINFGDFSNEREVKTRRNVERLNLEIMPGSQGKKGKGKNKKIIKGSAKG